MQRLQAVTDVARRLRQRFFPERQLYFRANGVVRFISFSPRVQMMGSTLGFAFLCWIAVTSFNFLAHDEIMAAKDARIAEMSRSYNALSEAMQELQGDVASTAERLKQRQEYLRQLLDGPAAGSPGDVGNEDTPKPQSWDGFSLHSLQSELAALEGRQKVIADRLLTLTNETIDSLDSALKVTGLSKDKLLALAETGSGAKPSPAQGGPYISEGDEAAGNGENDLMAPDASPADPFATLLLRRSELEELNRILENTPFNIPVGNYYISSGFGRRSDPMTHRGAIHYGVDMAGWWNSPIHATAAGVVTKAGRNGAYGNFIEIDHGNGFRTRYGHLRKINVKAGQKIERNEVIGRMGSTGRSTGTHLHYEIWFANRPLNPQKFFEAADNVRKIQQSVPHAS